LDRDKYFGLAPQEAFQDYGVVAPTRPRRTSEPESPQIRSLKEDYYETPKIRPTVGIRSTSFDPRLKTEPVHGVESAGLGTSTFLEGAPAPKSAIERANAEEEDGGGLVRKKSLVQKIKGRRGTGERSPPPMSGPLLTPNNTASVDPAYNPFFKEGQFVERVESVPTNGARERADSGGSDKGVNGTSGLIGRVKSLKISGGRKGRRVEE
jgi:Pal1 cell morphology protein